MMSSEGDRPTTLATMQADIAAKRDSQLKSGKAPNSNSQQEKKSSTSSGEQVTVLNFPVSETGRQKDKTGNAERGASTKWWLGPAMAAATLRDRHAHEGTTEEYECSYCIDGIIWIQTRWCK